MPSNIDKDAFYFPHFSNARHDRKIKRLRKQLAVEGYGIFFMLLEVLREQTDYRYPMEDVDLLADEFGTSTEKVQAVIEGFDLFEIDDENNFFSSNLVFYLKPMFEQRNRKTIGSHKGNLIRYNYISKEDADKMTPDEIVKLAHKHGFDTDKASNILDFSLSDRLPMPNRSLTDRSSSQRKVDENKREKNKTNEMKTNESTINGVQSEPSPISQMRDTLANHYQELFTSLQPASTWGNFAQERKTLNDLARKTRNLIADISPDFSEIEMANLLMNELRQKQIRATNDYWRNVKLCPSGFMSRWTELVQLASKRFQQQQHADELDMGGFYDDEAGF